MPSVPEHEQCPAEVLMKKELKLNMSTGTPAPCVRPKS